MHRFSSLSLLLLAVLVSVEARLPSSPFPVSKQPPDSVYVFFNDFFNAPSEAIMFQTLQGLVAQTQPALYWISNPSYQLFIDDLSQPPYSLTVLNGTSYFPTYVELVQSYNSSIAGFIYYNVGDESQNVAVSLSGVMQAIAVNSDLLPLMQNLNIPMLVDARGLDVNYLMGQSSPACPPSVCGNLNTRVISVQTPAISNCLHDMTVFSQGVQFFSSFPSPSTDSLFATFSQRGVCPGGASPCGGRVMGWTSDELGMVSTASVQGYQVHASDFAENLSLLSNIIPQQPFVQQTHTHANTVPGKDEPKHTVCFVMTDGDNIQWTLNSMLTDPRWYGSPQRGQAPIGWTVSPALSELAPSVLSRLYSTATPNDFFVAGPSGVGYNYPDLFSSSVAPSAASALEAYSSFADLSILNILDTAYDPSNPPAFLTQMLQQSSIDGAFMSLYSGAFQQGSISWVAGKPVIGERFQLAAGANDPVSLAQQLNAQSTDESKSDGYSLVHVVVWSMTVSDVVHTVSMLKDHVRVVLPDEFVQRVHDHVHH